MVIFLLILIIIIIVLYFFNFKRLKISSINMFTGQLKTGKSALSLRYALFYYKSAVRNYYIKKIMNYCMYNFGYYQDIEKPLLYSNIPLGINYVPLTKDILLRRERIAYKSIVFIDEMSLIADNYDFKDKQFNEQVKLFFKLFGHMSRGGKLFINTQNIEDNHYIVKRCINQYLYIHHKIRLPLISIFKVREMIYNEGVQNIVNNDAEEDLKTIIISNSTFKKYDCYCYSILTDNLHYQNKYFKRLYKKIRNILTFKK